jgi:hypothetical protein
MRQTVQINGINTTLLMRWFPLHCYAAGFLHVLFSPAWLKECISSGGLS